MAFTVQHIRSNEPDRRPKPEDLVDGQIAINQHDSGPGMFFRTTDGNLVKVGPAYISGVEPVPQNHTPFLMGEQWLDTSSASPVLKIWDGQEWLEASKDMSSVKDNVIPETDCIYDLGSPTHRWGNLFTCDIDLSNEGGMNDVDGTWGSYLIQEGEDDLFLINRRSGKKFKFVLQEVK
jgi:hypothetical protein